MMCYLKTLEQLSKNRIEIKNIASLTSLLLFQLQKVVFEHRCESLGLRKLGQEVSFVWRCDSLELLFNYGLIDAILKIARLSYLRQFL